MELQVLRTLHLTLHLLHQLISLCLGSKQLKDMNVESLVPDGWRWGHMNWFNGDHHHLFSLLFTPNHLVARDVHSPQTWENQRSLVYTWYITPGYSCFHRNAVGYSSKAPPCALSQVVSIGDQPFGFWRAGTCGLWILWKWQAKIHELSCYVQLPTSWCCDWKWGNGPGLSGSNLK